MSRFIDPEKRTKELNDAVACLMKLAPNLRCVACYEVLEERMRSAADKHYGKDTHAQAWAGWLRNKREPHWVGNDVMPRADHCETRRDKDGRKFYISQPYGLDIEDLRALVAFCDDRNLTCSVEAMSWHYPGWTLLVVVETKEQRDERYANRMSSAGTETA